MGTSRTAGAGCALLADRHAAQTEGLRNLLSAMFGAVITVADTASLMKVAENLEPALAVIDLSLVQGGSFEWLKRFRARCPRCRVVLVGNRGDASLREAASEAGAEAVIGEQSIAGELMATIDAMFAGPGATSADVLKSP